MQQTRHHILEILRELGHATVDDIVAELQKRRGKITAVTVRHHLTRLQEEELVTSPELRRRSTPGRPQHVYSLTEKAQEHFPNNYQHLAGELVMQLQQQLPPDSVNVILEGVGTHMAAQAHITATSMRERLDQVVNYLNTQGYEAHWETSDGGYILHTSNCPYHHINHLGMGDEPALCHMDMRLVSALVGVVPRRIARMTDGDTTCSYFIPASSS